MSFKRVRLAYPTGTKEVIHTDICHIVCTPENSAKSAKISVFPVLHESFLQHCDTFPTDSNGHDQINITIRKQERSVELFRMATALQQQLAAIAANSTQQLDLKAQKARHSKSLLFEPKDAAGQSFDSIYQICSEGFDELCMLDGRFLPFARNLFSEQSKFEDRTQMTAHENEELDVVIRSFLGLLGGRLLLRPGMRAAEWLVRRFRVQEYNTETLVLSFLPYHDSHIFPTLLSILPAQLSSSFKFLHPYMKSLTSPPRHAVLSAAVNNTGFFSAFSQYTIDVARERHHSAILIGFWASITAQGMNGMIDASRSGRDSIRKQREEELLLRIIPVLQSALTIKGVPELFLGSCMIMTILVTKASLNDTVIDAMMEAIASAWTDRTIDDGMVCLAVMSEERAAAALPGPLTRSLLRTSNTIQRIRSIAASHRVERLALGLGLGTIAHLVPKNSNTFATVEQIIDSGLLSDVNQSVLYRSILQLAEQPIINAELQDQVSGLISEAFASSIKGPLISKVVADVGINISMLEQRLKTVLPRLEDNSDVEQEDRQMLDAEEPEEPQAIDAMLASLPESSNDKLSFLDPRNDHLFYAYSRAFTANASTGTALQRLLNSSALHRETAFETPAFFSFLARVWSGSFQVSVRASALRAASLRLDEVNSKGLDLQALLPYVLVALADPSQKIRNAAADVAIRIDQAYNNKDEKNKISKSIPTWSLGTFYGPTSKEIQWLPAADASKLLHYVFVPRLEESVLDPALIARTTSDALNGNAELKSSQRAPVFSYFASHVAALPPFSARICLLEILNRVGKAGSHARATILLPVVQAWARKTTSQVEAECTAQVVEAGDMDRVLLGAVTHRSADELQCLKSIAAGVTGSRPEIAVVAFQRLRQLWPAMKPNSRNALISFLVDLSLDEKKTPLDESLQAESLETLRSLELPTEVLRALLEDLPDTAQMQDGPGPAKKRRTSKSEAAKAPVRDTARLNVAIRKITLALELVESSKPERHPDLLKSLFHILGELHHYKTFLSSDLVYLQSLVLGCILAVVNELQASPGNKPDHSVIRADLVVECVRSTSSTQVHNAALLLISSLASWAPEVVLHSVMPIFTFMSNTLLRQSDDYSAHVIDQTISQVIPPLADSLKSKGKDLISGTAELLLSFTAAFEHIPLHRRSRLFTHLVKRLGPDEALPAVMAMLVEKHPTDESVQQFALELLLTFPGTTQMIAARRYFDLVVDALQPKRTVSDIILGFGDKTSKQVEDSACALLERLSQFLESKELRIKLSRTLAKMDSAATVLRSEYSDMLTANTELQTTVNRNSALLAASHSVLLAILGLFPALEFIKTAQTLLSGSDQAVQQQVLRSLESHISHTKRGNDVARQALVDFLPRLTSIVSESSMMTLKHTAVSCIDQIAEKFGKKDRTAVLNAAQAVAGPQALGSDDMSLRVSSILCFASMVDVLQDDFIPILPKVLSAAFDYLASTLGDATPSLAMHSAVFALSTAVLDCLPWMFAANFLDRILTLAQISSCKLMDSEAVESRSGFYTLAAKQISAQEMLSAIDRTWSSAVSNGVLPVTEQLKLLQYTVQYHTKANVIKNAQLLFNVLMQAFDLRRVMELQDVEEVSRLQQTTNQIALDMTLKLNDVTFKPFFVRLVDWATEGLPKTNVLGLTLRSSSLYSFALALFDQLKSIVTSYAAFILEHAAAILKDAVPRTQAQRDLQSTILQALSSSFQHDQDDFWQSPAHFNAIAGPLLKQLTHAKHIDATTHVIPAISDFATAASSPDHHKELNTAIMQYTRSEDAQIRLAAVKSEQSLTEKLGEDWLALLPEMLPFISELQEDDDETIERETLKWVNMIEGILGESLEGMLQ